MMILDWKELKNNVKVDDVNLNWNECEARTWNNDGPRWFATNIIEYKRLHGQIQTLNAQLLVQGL